MSIDREGLEEGQRQLLIPFNHQTILQYQSCVLRPVCLAVCILVKYFRNILYIKKAKEDSKLSKNIEQRAES